MLSLVRRLLDRAAGMCAPAWAVLRGCGLVSLVLLTASLLLRVGYDAAGHPHWRHLASDLLRTPAAILLVGVLASACLEERFGQ